MKWLKMTKATKMSGTNATVADTFGMWRAPMLNDPILPACSSQHEPCMHALSALVERAIHGELPPPAEVERGKKALAAAGFRLSWDSREFLSDGSGYPAELHCSGCGWEGNSDERAEGGSCPNCGSWSVGDT